MADTNNPQGKVCTGDCFACSYQQAWLCTSQHTLRLLRELQELRQQVNEMRAKFSDTPTPPIQTEVVEPEPEQEPKPKKK